MRGNLLGGRYQVLRVLANGGFGQTYVAEDLHRPGKPQCVVKHLQPNNVNSQFLQNARRLFQTEAEILEKLGNHDQIPRLLAYFEENQEFYLVQEFISGHTLSEELHGVPWSESQVYQLLQEILEILAFVHSYGVIHRDIKPDNILRRQHDGKLVLVDFGSVKQAWAQVVTSQGQTTHTFISIMPATIAVGTPGYMPTEQGRGRPQPNSDIYALGMIAIQALTGVNPTQLVEASDNGEIVWQHRANVSEELASIVTKMVRYNFKNRYQTAAEALAAIQQLNNPRLRRRETKISTEQQLPSPTPSAPALPEELSSQNLSLVTPLNSSNSRINPPSSVTASNPDSESRVTTTAASATQPTVFSPLEPQDVDSLQNAIYTDGMNTPTDQKKSSKRRASIPIICRRHRLWIGVAVTAVLMSIAAFYAIKAQEASKQWQKGWEKNNSSRQAANSNLKVGKPPQAIKNVAKPIDNPYRQKQLAPIIQPAEVKTARSKITTSRAKRSVTIRTTRHPRRQFVRATTRTPVKTAPKRVTKVVTRQPRRIVTRSRTRLFNRRAIHASSRRLPSSAIRRPVRTIPRRLPASIAKRSTSWSTRVGLTGSTARGSTHLNHKRTARAAKIVRSNLARRN